MSEFDTTGPIDVTVEISVGDLRVKAGDRPGTVVRVRPSDPGSDVDVRAAEQTRVECADRSLLVKAPKQRGLGIFGRPGSIDVDITLAAGSQLHAEAGVASVHTTGPLGITRVKIGAGDIRIEHAAMVDAHTGSGGLAVDRVDGTLDASTGSGQVRLGALHGAATVKNSNGDTRIGSVTGDLRARAANGDVLIGDAAASVVATSANGHIRIRSVSGGTVSMKTALGELEVGVPEGTAAYLDVHTGFGKLHSRLEASGPPTGDEPTVQIHARTSYGDIIVRRP